jgi:hypothetical protein
LFLSSVKFVQKIIKSEGENKSSYVLQIFFMFSFYRLLQGSI